MTHTCKHCGSNAIIHLSSIDTKLCADCKQYDHWPLKPGQESVLIKGKKGVDTNNASR